MRIIHSLIHILSIDPFNTLSLCYSSPTAQNCTKMGLEAKNKMRNLLASCNGHLLVAGLCEYIFEFYAIEILANGGNFTWWELVHENAKKNSNGTILHVPHSTKAIAVNVSSEHALNQLYLLKCKNHVAIDAWFPGNRPFQMTVGKTHSIHSQILKEWKYLKKLKWQKVKLKWKRIFIATSSAQLLHFHLETSKTIETICFNDILSRYNKNN